MNSALQYIYQHPLFSTEDLQKISDAHVPVEFKKNAFLLKEGEIAHEYYILEKGLVRAFVHDSDNNDITTEFFCENEIVIIPSSLFQKIPSQENLQTIIDCKFLKIQYDDFQELFHTIEGMREWGRMWFTYQLFAVKNQKIEMITESATHRYLKLMKDKPEIIQNAPLKYIASYLGITDTSLSRIRREI